jgi:hypothetical protein
MPPIQIEFCRHVRVISALRYTGCQLSCMRSGGDCQEAAELACYHFKPTDGIPDPLYQFTWKVRILGSSPRVQLTERSQYRTMDVLVINGIIGECTRWSNLTRPQTIPIRLHRRPPPLVTLESSVHTSLFQLLDQLLQLRLGLGRRQWLWSRGALGPVQPIDEGKVQRMAVHVELSDLGSC